MMFHSTTCFARGSGQSRGLRGTTVAAVVFLFLPAATLVTGGCSRAPAYANYQAKHTLPEDYDAAGSGPTRPLAMTGQVVVSADPLWKQYAARTQAFVTYGAGSTVQSGSAAEPRTGGSGKITADKGGTGKSAPTRAPRKAAGKKTGKTTAKKGGKSATPQASAGSAGLFPEPVCPEGCIPAPGYKRATPAPAQSSTPAAQPSAPVPAPNASTAAPVPSVTPSTAFAPPPDSTGRASAPGNGKVETPASVQSPANASTSTPAPVAPAPATQPPSSAVQPPVPGAQPEPPALPALPARSTPSGPAAPDGGRLLPPVGGQPTSERDPALAPPGSSGLGYAPAPPPL
ncbi:MAG: hypothetical protein LBC14_02560 [Desulfovibrio sp.]|jgi:hypothetical protein|nr:hypothetical protein [Desulfovibrio sp.]